MQIRFQNSESQLPSKTEFEAVKKTYAMRINSSQVVFGFCSKVILLVSVFLFAFQNVHAQTYPVTSIVNVNGTGLPYLEGYLLNNPNELLTTLILNDDDYESIDVSIRVHIFGEGVDIRTDPDFVGDLHTLMFNVPYTLTGLDLANYFNPDYLIFQGISKAAFLQGGKLPEGFYSICIEAIDPFKPEEGAVSNFGCASTMLEIHKPPTLVSLIGDQDYLPIQNYYFDWVDNHIGFRADYNLFIYEKATGLTQDEVLDFIPPIVIELKNSQDQYLYTLLDPLLFENQPYLIRVQAYDPTGRNTFENNGFSNIEEFRLSKGCVSDSDGDGVCDVDDQCPGQDDTVDSDLNGVPDCLEGGGGKSCSIGDPCDDGLKCTVSDVIIDLDCNCQGTPVADSDGDGVCDDADQCPGQNDAVDSDGNGIPDCLEGGCKTGDMCDDGDPCTYFDKVVGPKCECVGQEAPDSDGDGVCDPEDQCNGGDDTIDDNNDGIPDCLQCNIGDLCDDGDPCTYFDQYVGIKCDCQGTLAPDSDGDGVCDPQDVCPGEDDNIDHDNDGVPDGCDPDLDCTIGDPCDDGDPCTLNDVIISTDCGCAGTQQDSDNDGVGDCYDICPGGNDYLDTDGDGTPDDCECTVGDPCDDNNLNTINDAYDADCNCVGSNVPTPVATEATNLDPTTLSFTANWEQMFGVSEYYLTVSTGAAFDPSDILVGFDAVAVIGLSLPVGGNSIDSLYYYKVQALVNGNISGWSNMITVNFGTDCSIGTPPPYDCSATDPAFTEVANLNLRDNLNVGDQIWAGDFKVDITQVSGGNGPWSGRGQIPLPIMDKRVKVNVEFHNIYVNSACRLVGEGYMNVTGAGAQLISKEFAELINDIVGYLELIDGALQSLENTLNAINEGINQTDTLKDYFSEGVDFDVVGGGADFIKEEYPYLPDSLVENLEDAVDCFGQAITNGADPAVCNEQFGDAINDLVSALNEMYDSEEQVLFFEDGQMQYGLDSIGHETFRQEYNTLTVAGEEYTVSWKSIARGQTQLEPVKAKLKNGGAFPSYIEFEDNQKTAVSSTGGNEKTLSLVPGAGPGTSQIYAVEKYADSVKIAGKLNLVTYDLNSIDVVLVPVQGSSGPAISLPYLNETEIQDEIQRVFNQSVTTVNLSLAPPLNVPVFDGMMDAFSADAGSKYSIEMDSIINRLPTSGADTFYLFIVNEYDGSTLGMMPMGSQFGFVYHQNNLDAKDKFGVDTDDKEQYTKTIAHELGHGAFKLRHSFKAWSNSSEGETDNLMDYSMGTRLIKPQWDKVHDPDLLIGVFHGGEEDAELTISAVFKCILPGFIAQHSIFHSNLGVRLKLDGQPYRPVAFIGTNDLNQRFVKGGVLMIAGPNGEIYALAKNDHIYPHYYLRTEGGIDVTQMLDPSDPSSPIYGANGAPAIEVKIGPDCIANIGNSVDPPVSIQLSSCNCFGSGNATAGNIVVDYTTNVAPMAIAKALNTLRGTRLNTEVEVSLFIIDDNTQQADLDAIASAISNLGPKGLVATLKFNPGGTHDPLKLDFGSAITQTSSDFQTLLIAAINDYQNLQMWVTLQSLDLLTDLLDGVAHMVGKAKMPKKFYDPDDPDYVPALGEIHRYLRLFILQPPGTPILSSALLAQIPGVNQGEYDDYRVEFAALCGFYNGLISQIEGIPMLASLLVKVTTNEDVDDGKGGTFKMRDKLRESFDNFSNDCWTQGGSLGFCIWDTLFTKIQQAHTGTPCKVAHQVGKDFADVATLFLAFAKVGKMGKVNALLQRVDPTTYIFKGIGALYRFTADAASYTYRLGNAGLKLGLIGVETGAIKGLKIIGDAFEYEITQAIRLLNGGDLPNMQLALDGSGKLKVAHGDPDIAGWDLNPLLDKANEKLHDAYGNFIVQMSKKNADGSQSHKLALAGKISTPNFTALRDHLPQGSAARQALDDLPAAARDKLDDDLADADLMAFLKGSTPAIPVVNRIKAWEIADVCGLPRASKEYIRVLSLRVSNATNPLTKVDAETVFVRAELLDEAVGSSKMKEAIRDLLGNEKYLNHEDLLPNTKSFFTKSGQPVLLQHKTQLNEYKEGFYWINRDNQPIIVSKELSPGNKPPNEVDAILPYRNGIMEAKCAQKLKNQAVNVSVALENIMDKFRVPGKLDQSIKDQWPMRFGQIEITNGAFPNMTKEVEFAKAIDDMGVIGSVTGQHKYSITELKTLQELHVVFPDGRARLIVQPHHWDTLTN